MRYAVVSKGLSLAEIKSKCLEYGAINLREMPATRQVFCELGEEAATRLSLVQGLAVKSLGKVSVQRMVVPEEESVAESGCRIGYFFQPWRESVTPALTGEGLTVVILDSGIRKTHQDLAGKVIYEKNFTSSASATDIFDHGTGVAFTVLEVSPGASLMNIKVIGDDGEGEAEDVIAGIDEICALVQSALDRGLPVTDPEYPNVVNLSLGATDDGDPENPLRLACQTAVAEYGLDVIAAAGNEGPGASTILLPACDPDVLSVGGICSDQFTIWDKSSRGPTLEGYIKPDIVFWSTGIYLASALADDAYAVKSGNSFAAPVASSIIGLLCEAGRRVYGEDWHMSWKDIMSIAPLFCLKPSDAPLAKDNSYGYGLPALGAMINQITQSVAPQPSMSDIITPVIGLGMMGMLTTTIIKAANRR